MMSKPEHFLTTDENWTYRQPSVGFKAQYVAVTCGSDKRKVEAVGAATTCREGVIHNARQTFQKTLCQKVITGPGDWQFTMKKVREPDLEDPKAKKARGTHLMIAIKALSIPKQPEASKEDLEKFILAADTVLGPMCVLLGHHRPEGDWWRTDPKKMFSTQLSQKYICWFGSDNFFLQHPVLVAIVTGLYRQVALLCSAGHADRILESVDRKEIEECLSTGSWKQALLILQKTRPFIEVPVAKNGQFGNYAFPIGYWQRMHRLQIGARRHGYEKILGQDFMEGWSLELKGTNWTGLYNFWGEKESTSEAHSRLMKLGKPRSKQSESESVTNST